MFKPVLLSLVAFLANSVWSQSLSFHSGIGMDSLAISDLDSLVFRDIAADDATLLAYTKTSSKNWKTKAIDSIKIKPANSVKPPDTGRTNVGLFWMFLGDSQTAGRATGETISHVTAFRTIWDKSFPTQNNESAYINGESGRILSETVTHYGGRTERANRTWVHFQESGGQVGIGQASASEFGATWNAFIRKIKSESPNAIISTETACSFGREGETGRNWIPYNQALRDNQALLAKEGIKVYVSEVERNIKALDVAVGAGNVWFQASETNAYHYKDLGNLMVALSLVAALGYDVNQLDLSLITTVSAPNKAKCLEILNKF